MRLRRGGQAGFTLIETLLAMVLMLIVLTATLAVFSVMERGAVTNQRLNANQQQARVATDTLAKRLRNLASPSDSVNPLDQQPLERAEAQDLIFRTVKSDGTPTTSNPQNLQRYRYCLGADKVLYEQRQTWTGLLPATPATTGCPGTTASGWTQTRRVVANVVNGTKPVFNYQGSVVPGKYSELTSVLPADFPTAIALRTTLDIDPDTMRRPGATTLSTRVFLRNQNRLPAAEFTVSASGRAITLNASSSVDPEGNRLTYLWLDNNVALTDPATGAPLGFLPKATYRFDATAGAHSFSVRVKDVGNLTALASPARTVTCTGTPTILCTVSP